MKALIPVLLLAIVSATAFAAKGGYPINDRCPVDDNEVRIIYRVFTEKGTVAFCCVDCMETFQKNPSRFVVKPREGK